MRWRRQVIRYTYCAGTRWGGLTNPTCSCCETELEVLLCRWSAGIRASLVDSRASRGSPALSTDMEAEQDTACCALARITPELRAAAFRVYADLYIAHYTGALAAAGAVARRRGVLLAFDAEDFESGYYEYNSGPRAIDRLTEDIEREYLPDCCYMTAASAGIGAAYAAKYGIAKPITVLNVFPRSERPLHFRETNAQEPLKLHWFSQTIGGDRGLEDVIGAMAILRDARIELHLRGRCVRDTRTSCCSSRGTGESIPLQSSFLHRRFPKR